RIKGLTYLEPKRRCLGAAGNRPGNTLWRRAKPGHCCSDFQSYRRTTREFVHLRCRPLIVAIGTAGETACPTLLDQSFGKVGGAGGFACRWKLISIAIQSRKRLCNPVCGEAALCYKFVLV